MHNLIVSCVFIAHWHLAVYLHLGCSQLMTTLLLAMFFFYVTSFMHFSHNVFLSVLCEQANLIQNTKQQCRQVKQVPPSVFSSATNFHTFSFLQPYTFTEDYFKLAVTIFHSAIG